MKGIIIVDIPVDESHEIDSYGMVADLNIYSETPTTRKDLDFILKHVDIRPMPNLKYMSLKDEHDDLIFQMGWNACIDEILGEEE